MRLIPKHADAMVSSIEASMYNLSKKEKDFIKSVKWLIKNDLRLSEAQSKWLKDINDKSY